MKNLLLKLSQGSRHQNALIVGTCLAFGSILYWAHSDSSDGKLPIRQELIEAIIGRYDRDDGSTGGQCKAYLQTVFNETANELGIKLPDGSNPIMPRNDGGFRWKNDPQRGFFQLGQILPQAGNKLAAVTWMLTQVEKGDVIQCGTAAGAEGGKLHTISITSDYSAGQPITWADSNWTHKELVNSHQSKSLAALASWISANAELSTGSEPQGVTIYRLRDDLTK